jgi:single-strand DNA-binding protein
MANYNKVILAGNLTRDPQLSATPSNTQVCEFGMAINHRWRGQDGENRESTCFIDCVLYGRQAETFNQYMSKGQPVLVEGRLDFRQWETPEGQKRSKHSVFVQSFQFLGGRDGGGGGGSDGGGGGYRSSGGPTPGPGPGHDSGPRRGDQPHSDAPPSSGGEQSSYSDQPPPPGGEGDIPF